MLANLRVGLPGAFTRILTPAAVRPLLPTPAPCLFPQFEADHSLINEHGQAFKNRQAVLPICSDQPHLPEPLPHPKLRGRGPCSRHVELT